MFSITEFWLGNPGSPLESILCLSGLCLPRKCPAVTPGGHEKKPCNYSGLGLSVNLPLKAEKWHVDILESGMRLCLKAECKISI